MSASDQGLGCAALKRAVRFVSTLGQLTERSCFKNIGSKTDSIKFGMHLFVLLLILLADQGVVAKDCRLQRQRFNSTFEDMLAEAPALRQTVLRLQPFAKLFPECIDKPSCMDLWANVRDTAPATCDATCWADVESTFLRKHGECVGVVEASCVSRLRAQKDCNESCRSTFIETNADCRNMFAGNCDKKHETYDAKYARFSVPTHVRREPFLTVFPECAECALKRSGALALASENSEDLNTFQMNFSKHFPECTGSPIAAASSMRRRLKQRYNLCNIGSNGHYELSGNCSITETITVKKGDVLEIIGVLGPNGAKATIDGGWDGSHNSNTGVRLFEIEQGGSLNVDNMILTHGQVRLEV